MVLKSDDLKLVQNGGKALKGLALLLTILVPVLYALAIVLARGRRRISRGPSSSSAFR